MQVKSENLVINMDIIDKKGSLMETLYTYLTKIIINPISNVRFLESGTDITGICLQAKSVICHQQEADSGS